jgi:hypothetical protein
MHHTVKKRKNKTKTSPAVICTGLLASSMIHQERKKTWKFWLEQLRLHKMRRVAASQKDHFVPWAQDGRPQPWVCNLLLQFITHRRCQPIWTAATWVLGTFACSIFLLVIDSPSGVYVRWLLTGIRCAIVVHVLHTVCVWGHPSLLVTGSNVRVLCWRDFGATTCIQIIQHFYAPAVVPVYVQYTLYSSSPQSILSY